MTYREEPSKRCINFPCAKPAGHDGKCSSEEPSKPTGGMATGDAADTMIISMAHYREILQAKPSLSPEMQTDGCDECEGYHGLHRIDCSKLPAAKCPLSTEMAELVALLKKSKQLASIGYRIGEADMRGHDKAGERYGKQQDELLAEINSKLDALEGKSL